MFCFNLYTVRIQVFFNIVFVTTDTKFLDSHSFAFYSVYHGVFRPAISGKGLSKWLRRKSVAYDKKSLSSSEARNWLKTDKTKRNFGTVYLCPRPAFTCYMALTDFSSVHSLVKCHRQMDFFQSCCLQDCFRVVLVKKIWSKIIPKFFVLFCVQLRCKTVLFWA